MLLMHQTGVQRHPAFYICHGCGFIGQVGVSPVPVRYRSDTEDDFQRRLEQAFAEGRPPFWMKNARAKDE